MFVGAQLKRVARRIATFSVALAAGMSLLTAAWAMRVAPMVSELTTTGAGSTARIEVGNIGAAALPFETRITRIEFDENGELIETPADDQFLVFPPQGVVPVGGRQVVRAQWVGDQDLKASRAFYLSVRQLPVAVEEGQANAAGAQVQVVYHMKALITVAPPGSEPKVEVVEATPTTIAVAPAEIQTPGAPQAAPKATAKVPGIHVKVRNTGTRYALMSGPNWIVEGQAPDGSPLKLKVSAEKISQAVGVVYLPPSVGERVFDVPTDADLGPGPIQVRFEK